MIIEWLHEDRSKLRKLFDSHTSFRAVIFPALDQGRGNMWSNSLEAPTVARLQLVIINVLAGDPTIAEATELIQMIEPLQLVIGPNEGWNQLIRDLWGEQLGIQERTLFSPQSLDIEHLRRLRNQLPDGYRLERMDLETIKRVDKRKAMHIPTFFGSSKEFHKSGIGYCIKFEDEAVCMASTFTPYTNEFEIQIDTIDPFHRQKGLATVASAALIIHALENGIVPQWDAANEISFRLALKLGYTNPTHWEAYYLKPKTW
ncbi:MAG: GNAT family N-acetyltransferase [Candidatus Thorarchaeota archaeon]